MALFPGLNTHSKTIKAGMKIHGSTVHVVTDKLDDGEIIEQKSIKITKGLKLYMLRAENTKLCIELTCDALRKFSRDGIFRSIPQRKIGRYYSN